MNVFRYGIEGDLRFRKDGGEPCTTVRRSEGWVFREDGTLVAVRTNSKYALVNYDERLFNEDPVPWAAANLRYRELNREWDHAWKEYCRRTGRHPKGDDGRRDRIAILTRYLTNEWSPSDLPPWFWDVPEEPPFVPPLAVSTYEWGEITIRGGHPHTEILHSERWQVPEAQLLLEKPGIDDWAPGKFEEGDPLPEEYAAENHRYEWAKAEWSQCYGVHGPQRVRPVRVARAPSDVDQRDEESDGDSASSGGSPDRA